MKKIRLALLFFVGVVVGVIGTVLLVPSDETTATQVRQGGFSLINPLLECEIGQQSHTQLAGLKYSLEEVVEEMQQQGIIDDASIYFRDLNNGPTIGINAEEEFSPASLLKLPILMTYYKQAETDRTLLTKKVKVELDQDRNSWESFTSKNFVQPGMEYTNDELIRSMIVSSDNNAMVMLATGISLMVQDKVYTEIGVSIPGVKGLNDFMTVKEYASFFRMLYNASYLTPAFSEKALSLLTESEFGEGLRKGVPSTVKVAHKFGERTYEGKKQLHDCGIVYVTDKPYLLCVMTRGNDFEKLAQGISRISAHVYTDITKQ